MTTTEPLRAPTRVLPYPTAPPAPPAAGDAGRPAGPSRARVALPLIAGIGLIAALTPARELWPVQLVLVVLLLTVPGLALLRALRVPSIAIAGMPVYVPGASLVVLLAAGLGANMIGPEIGVEAPLRTIPLLTAVAGLSLALTAIAAVPRPEPGLRGGMRLLPRARDLWPLALPLASAVGASRLTTGEGPGAAIAATTACAVALALALIVAPRLSRGQMALLLYGVGLALVWSFSLRGGFVYGFDISAEYQVMHSTGVAGVWDLAHPDDAYGAMLSLTVLPAVFHDIAGVSELTLLKAVYPAVFALFPVVVFLTARRFLAPRYAAAAAALIIVQSYFFQQIPAIARQEIALVAFAVLVAVLVDRKVPRYPRLGLAALLGLALVVSHYSTTYLAIAVLGLGVILQLVVSLWRPVPRAGVALVGAFVVTLAGAVLWYGPLTDSASNLGGFRESVRTEGLQFLPNREAGESLVDSYLKGNTTTRIDAARYEDLSARDYAANRPFVVPLPEATDPRYALRDAAVPNDPARAPAAEDAVSSASLAVQQLINVISVLAVIALMLRRRGPAALRVLAILGVSTLAILVTIRLSGTAANAYNQERAFLQAMVPLAVALAWALQSGVRRMRRLGAVGVAAMALGAALLLVSTSGLAGATLGAGATGNLADHGEDYERFYSTAPELASARWLGSAKPPNALLYTDRYGQLRVLSQVGASSSPLLDPTPRTLDQNAWVYASAANVVEGRARSVNSGHFATYAFPARFLDDTFDTVYANGSSEVFHR